MLVGWESEEFSKTEKKTIEGVTERRQQKKYLEAKRRAKSVAYVAKRKAQEEKLSQLESNDSKNFIFKLNKRMKCENQDIVGDKCVKNDERCLTYDGSVKLKAC